MAFFLDRDHYTESSNKTVEWDEPNATFAYRTYDNGDWKSRPVTQPFAVDVWSARHGYEQWVGEEKNRTKVYSLASVSDKMPAKPDGKHACIYAVPVYSAEFGGQRDLIVKGKEPTAAFCDMFEEVAGVLAENVPKKEHSHPIPVIAYQPEITDFGTTPIFNIEDWKKRPAHWSKPIVCFDR